MVGQGESSPTPKLSAEIQPDNPDGIDITLENLQNGPKIDIDSTDSNLIDRRAVEETKIQPRERPSEIQILEKNSEMTDENEPTEKHNDTIKVSG